MAIILMIVVLMGLAIAVLWWTAGETNRIDSERTARALVNAVAGEATELQAMAEDNGNWDDAADALIDDVDPAAFMTESYADISAAAVLYDAVAVVDSQARPVIAMRRGEVTMDDPRGWIGADLSLLIASAVREDGAASGLVSGNDGVRLVGISRILPTSSDRLAAYERAGGPARYIIFSRPFGRHDLLGISSALVVADLSLGDADAAGGSAFASDGTHNIATLRAISGRPVATLAWRPTAPANRAIWRSLPILIAALVIALIASALLLKRSYAALAHINRVASLDALSSLPNRRTLRAMMRRALADHHDVALAFIDLDGFKAINDLYGHGVGDELIVKCAEFITAIAPTRGGAARLGGDEFAVFACGPAANVRLEGVCGALLSRLQEPFHIGDRTISIGASIGLADRNGSEADVAELMRRADVAMYVAKRAGKMRLEWFSSDHDLERSDALAIEQRLRSALDREEFALVYQPLIEANDGGTIGFEALLRWDSGVAPPIGPDRFIPIAEDTGLIDRIGQFVLRRACIDALNWPVAMVLSVNISSAQLRNPHFPDMVAGILAETEFPAQRLMLEITETYIVADPALARQVLAALRTLGVRVALDDFGSGFASIGFLRKFTFDTLKIDRTLVIEAAGDQAARALLHSSVAVARALGIKTVAEGVESEAQAVIMRAAGCDILQGWHFGRELAPDALDLSQPTERARRRSA